MAKVVLRLAASDQSPAHFLLGSDGVLSLSRLGGVQKKLQSVRKLSVSTNFEGLIEFSETPIVKMLSEKS